MRIEATKDYFIDPISSKRMIDPVQNTCGHTFEKSQLEGWKAKIKVGEVVNCPLCKAPISTLIRNILVKHALEILDDPANAVKNMIEDLTTEDQQIVQRAITVIKQRREEDQAKGIPSRLVQPENFIIKAIKDSSKDSSC